MPWKLSGELIGWLAKIYLSQLRDQKPGFFGVRTRAGQWDSSPPPMARGESNARATISQGLLTFVRDSRK